MTHPTLLVATWGEGLYSFSGNSPAQEISSQPVTGLALSGPQSALAILKNHSLIRRTPNGDWQTIATSEHELSCCLSIQNNIYVGTDEARLLRLSPQGTLNLVASFDLVPGRDTWFAGSAIVNGQRLGPPLGIRSLAANSNGTALFANVHVGGIPRSIDGGQTWHPTIDIHCDVHEVRAHPTNPDLVAAASAVGLCISYDAGASWTVKSDVLHAPHCSAVAFAGNDILVSASTDPFSPQGKVYRCSTQPESSIVPLAGGFPTFTQGKVDTNCIATSGATIAMVDSGGSLYLSNNFGLDWTQLSGTFPMPSSVLIL